MTIMVNEEYDKSSARSIYEYSLKLVGKSLSDLAELPPDIENKSNRGDLGSLIEKYFFRLTPDSQSGPDFPLAKLELKTTGLIHSSKRKFKAKERLVLGMINFDKLISETWEESSLLKKCRRMLILFYLYEREIPVSKRVFVLPPMLYEIPEGDLPIIRKDWEFIQKKIQDGKAHELSEGDTFYLGACRKGAGGEKEGLRTQPNSNIGAKARAFSFKTNYMNFLLEGHAIKEVGLQTSDNVTIETATQNRFAEFEGKLVSEISTELNYYKRNKNHKGFHRELAVKMLTRGRDSLPELKKAGIELKTIRLNKKGSPRESMSFPVFNYMEIIDEEWENSAFFEKLESKFLFVVYQENAEGEEFFAFAKYWNMPYEDRLEAERVWEDTKWRVRKDASNLPSSKESSVAHVRPKGRDGNDKAITPQGTMRLKQCFWLNAKYIRQVLESI